MLIVKTCTTPAAPEAAWRACTDFERYGDWLSLHRGWEGEAPTTVAAGTKISATTSFMNTQNRVEWSVDEYEPGRLLSMSAAAPSNAFIGFTVTIEPSAEGTQLTLTYDARSPMIKGPIEMLVRKNAAPEVETALRNLEALALSY